MELDSFVLSATLLLAVAALAVALFKRLGLGSVLGLLVAGIAFDTNAAHVADGRADGRPVYYGDVSDAELLAAVDLGTVETVVLTSNQPSSVLKAVSLIRAGHPKVTIIARARDLAACAVLTEAGADLAHPEALEASLRLGAEALKSLGLRSRNVDAVLGNAREEDYALVRDDESGAG